MSITVTSKPSRLTNSAAQWLQRQLEQAREVLEEAEACSSAAAAAEAATTSKAQKRAIGALLSRMARAHELARGFVEAEPVLRAILQAPAGASPTATRVRAVFRVLMERNPHADGLTAIRAAAQATLSADAEESATTIAERIVI